MMAREDWVEIGQVTTNGIIIIDKKKIAEICASELTDLQADRDSEERWANQYKEERDQNAKELKRLRKQHEHDLGMIHNLRQGLHDAIGLIIHFGGNPKYQKRMLESEDICPHAAQTRYVGCGGRAYWICDECKQVVKEAEREV